MQRPRSNRMPSKRLRLALAKATVMVTVLAGFLARPGSGLAQPRVVASIKPVHSLVAAVMEGIGNPRLLIEGAASPHDYRLRPSDARALSEARVVFWIGAGVETYLVKPLQGMAAQARSVPLAEAAGVKRLPAREGGAWVQDPGASGSTSSLHHGDEPHGHAGYNPHVWLSVENSKAMVRAIDAALSDADPANARLYAQNTATLLIRLEELDTYLRHRLSPVRNRPYVVFHDAYANLEADYGLRSVGSVTVSPERAPGAKRIAELQSEVRRLGAVCVFSEPQFEPRLVRTVTERTSARSAVLDPLGADLPQGPGQYFAMMKQLADSLADCLSEQMDRNQ